MKNLIYLFIIFITFSACGRVYSQKQIIIDLEKTTKAAIQKGYAASVRIWGFDTVKKVQNSAQFSGVVVSNSGYILTVSHAIQPNRVYKVMFPDGKEARAVGLGKMGFPAQQNRPDLGMVKIVSKGSWPVAEMGWSYSLKANQPCIGISYPESLNQRLPTVRFGRIAEVKNKYGFVESTCKMEPGDSGGPLFDNMGRVIGMHSRCRESEDSNFEVPIDLYRKYWTALTVAEDYKALPMDTTEVGSDPMVNKIIPLPFLTDLGASFSKLAPRSKGCCLTIRSNIKGVNQKVLGTVVMVKGKYYVVSKSSMVSADAEVSFDGRMIKATILKRDIENDLVLLRLDAKVKGAIPLDAIVETPDLKMEDLGNFLISPLPQGKRISILGSGYFNQPRKFSAGFLGAPARFIEGKITLIRPVPGSPAEKYDLKPGDQINKINGTAVVRAADYGAELTKYNPGDTVTIEGIRTKHDFEAKVVLGSRPQGTHVADQFQGGKSIRLDGFNTVFSHDPILRPEECGGPVFDLADNFLGINIARFSRTTTLVIPAETIRKFVVSSLK